MIEYQLKEYRDIFKEHALWTNYNNSHLHNPAYLTFSAFLYRINGVEYTEQSAEFRDAFNKEKTWMKLQND